MYSGPAMKTYASRGLSVGLAEPSLSWARARTRARARAGRI